MKGKILERIERAKELLKTAKHATMATVNADGSPHNSPFYFIIDDERKRVYWGSHPESLHCQNVSRTGQLFVVIYDMIEKGGLYLQCENGHELKGDDLVRGLEVHNKTRARDGMDPLPMEYYVSESAQRMYGADITKLWVNSAERDETGRVVKDFRHEITSEDLL